MKNKIEKYFNIWTALATLVLLLAIYYMAIYPWMNHWGITTTEASMALPGDGTEPGTIVVSTRGVSIHAPANQVWQWLVQIGADQAGFYSNDWLENLFLADIHNVDLIQPSWQSHQIGEPIPGASGVIYQRNFTWPTQAYEKGRMLYLWGPIVVLPVDDQTSILITRTIARPETFINEITYGWMHFVMERGMLFGIKARAEGNLNASIPLEIISNIGWIISTLAMAVLLFGLHRNWWWGLIPLAYASAIIAITADIWAAMAGFLWWGVITVGFMLLGRCFWKILILVLSIR